jgi:subtilisin family serine protease
LQYPAAYPGVVAVAGVDRDGYHAEISVMSRTAVLAAPAVDIMTTRARNIEPSGYGTGTGTSDATAIVAGVAALVRARFPELSAEEVIHRMTYTADDRGPAGRDAQYGYGIVNPVAALTADVPPLHPPTSDPPTTMPGRTTGVPWLLVLIGSAVALVVLAIVASAVFRRRGE